MTTTTTTNDQDKPFTTLPDLLPASITIPIIESGSPALLDSLLSHLPSTVLHLGQEFPTSTSVPAASLVDQADDAAASAATISSLSTAQKREVLARVLRSPQLRQSLASLTVALREGGLPSLSESLGVRVDNGGFAKGTAGEGAAGGRGGMPLGGGEAVEAFLEGVRRMVGEEEEEESSSGGGGGKGDDGRMETD